MIFLNVVIRWNAVISCLENRHVALAVVLLGIFIRNSYLIKSPQGILLSLQFCVLFSFGCTCVIGLFVECQAKSD